MGENEQRIRQAVRNRDRVWNKGQERVTTRT